MGHRCRTVGTMGIGALIWSVVVASEPASTEAARDGAFPFALAFDMKRLRFSETPVVSPDGTRVAYVVVDPTVASPPDVRFMPSGTPVSALGARIFLSGRTSGRDESPSSICGGTGNQWEPVWSPDGNTLAFYSDSQGTAQLWLLDLVDGSCRHIPTAMIRAGLLSGAQAQWTPDSRQVIVPLHPDPPLEEDLTRRARPDSTGSAKTPEAGAAPTAPQVFYSGSEDVETTAARPAGDTTQFMLGTYNGSAVAVEVATGQARVLIDSRQQPRPSTFRVSPSGRWVSVSSVMYSPSDMSVSWVKDLSLIPVAGGKQQVLERALPVSEKDVNYSEVDYRWHPLDDRIVYLSDQRAHVVSVGADGPGPSRPLALGLGDLVPPILYFSRDGRSVVLGLVAAGNSPERGPAALAMVSLDDGTHRVLPLPDPERFEFVDLIRANSDVLWQPDSRHLHMILRDRGTGEQIIRRADIGSGEQRTISSGLHLLKPAGSGGDHRSLFAVYQDVSTAPDIHRYNADLRQQSRASRIEPRVENVRIGPVRTLQTPVPMHDGRIQPVRTAVLLPVDTRPDQPLPAVVMIYPGSDRSALLTSFGGGRGNTVPSQIFTTRGYAVIMADVPLSPEGAPGHPLSNMTDVVLPQVYAAASAGLIDIRRVAISGNSFGGYGTAAVVSQSNLFRAAIPVNGRFNLAGELIDIDAGGSSHWVRWVESGQGRMGEPLWSNLQRYIANSPYFLIDRINTPMLIVAGADDAVVDAGLSRGMFVGLRRMGRPAQLAIYPGQGHSIVDWSVESAVDVSQRMIAFLDKHLKAP